MILAVAFLSDTGSGLLRSVLTNVSACDAMHWASAAPELGERVKGVLLVARHQARLLARPLDAVDDLARTLRLQLRSHLDVEQDGVAVRVALSCPRSPWSRRSA
ncbi:hypothetical protein ACQY0O_004973 [Thecaphora frezii]